MLAGPEGPRTIRRYRLSIIAIEQGRYSSLEMVQVAPACRSIPCCGYTPVVGDDDVLCERRRLVFAIIGSGKDGSTVEGDHG